jgi:pimeloyl-ACP methyl ester carboxylesterase
MSDTPTVVLVHGAFAESSSWNDVLTRLETAGVPAVALPNPLRGVASDAAGVRAYLRSLPGPVVLVGHSYGGAVASTAATGLDGVRALVFVAAFAPDKGEDIGTLSGKFPGSTLGETLHPVPQEDGSTDYFIELDRFHGQFAADVDARTAALAARTQRPLSSVALAEGAGEPAWRGIPSWFVFGDADLNIPVAAHRFMAERAGARAVTEIPGAAHALAVSQPDAVTETILAAIAGTA